MSTTVRIDAITVEHIYRLVRDDGSICHYFTSPDSSAQFIICDSLDGETGSRLTAPAYQSAGDVAR